MLFESQTTIAIDYDAVATAGKSVYGTILPAPARGYVHTLTASLVDSTGAVVGTELYSDADILFADDVYVDLLLLEQLDSFAGPTEAVVSKLAEVNPLANPGDLDLVYFRPLGIPYGARNRQFRTTGLPVLLRPDAASGTCTVQVYLAVAELRY